MLSIEGFFIQNHLNYSDPKLIIVLTIYSISVYNQISVNNKPIEIYHSIYFGEPELAPLSKLSKSTNNFKEV